MLINFYAFLTVTFLCAGLAIDVGMVQVRKLALQHSADAAALGALYEKTRGQSDWVAAGKTDASLNGFTDGSAGVTISIVSPPTSGSYAGDSTASQATVTQTYHTAFMAILGSNGNARPTSQAVSKASSNPDCIYLTGPGVWYYPLINLAFASFSSSCNMYIASTNHAINDDIGSAISFSNSAAIKSVGSSSWLSLIFGPVSPSPTYNSATESDPLAYETAPAFSSCTYTATTVWNTTATLNPGTYCGGITIGNSHVTFNPGLYIITGGLYWCSGSTINGTGVTFYLTQGGGWAYADFFILNSTVTLSAPTSASGGALAGIVVFADRNWSLDGTYGVDISSSYVSTNGIWYIPNVGLYNFVSTLTASSYLGIVTNNINNVTGTFTFPSPDYTAVSGGNPFHGSSIGGIVE